MSWKVYKLVYQAETPVYIGYHKLGFIQRTRYYIPGRSLWGAVTANLVKIRGKDYQEVGKEVNNYIRFTYLYPALGDKCLLPQYCPEGLKYGDYSASEFERIFIHAYTQTAVEPASLTAEEGSLHETEYIAPLVEIDNKVTPVHFVGYIFWQETYNLNLQEGLSRIYVGGERKYGFGQLRLLKQEDANTVFGYEIDTQDATITVPKDKPIPAHLVVNNKLILRGNIEPVVGREYEEDIQKGHIGFGQKVTNVKICWMPGSILTQEKRLKIGDCGILEA